MATAANNPYFQVGLDVFGRRCVVVGGNDEAADKSARLVEAGARVVVISHRVTEPIGVAAHRGDLVWECRDLDLDVDLADTFLVMNTLRSDADLVARLHAACTEQRVLLNTYDEPAKSDFGMAALVSRGHLRVSISSSNASPTMAGKLRRELEGVFDEEFVEFLDQLGKVRHALRERITDGPQRRARLRSLLDGFGLKATLELPQGWRQRLSDELAGDESARDELAQESSGRGVTRG